MNELTQAVINHQKSEGKALDYLGAGEHWMVVRDMTGEQFLETLLDHEVMDESKASLMRYYPEKVRLVELVYRNDLAAILLLMTRIQKAKNLAELLPPLTRESRGLYAVVAVAGAAIDRRLSNMRDI